MASISVFKSNLHKHKSFQNQKLRDQRLSRWSLVKLTKYDAKNTKYFPFILEKKKPQKRGIDGAHNEPWYAEQNSSSQKRWQKIDPKELCKGTVS